MKEWKEPARRLAEWLTDQRGMLQVGRQNPQLTEQIQSLNPQDPNAVHTYYIRKWTGLIRLLAILVPVCLMGLFLGGAKTQMVPKEGLTRPGQGTSQVTVTVHSAAEETEDDILEDVTLTVKERRYTDREAQDLLQAAIREIEETMLLENPSEDEVRSSLLLSTALQQGAVHAEWMTIPYGVISTDGQILKEVSGEGELVEIRATLSCQDQTLRYDTAVLVVPSARTEAEQFSEDLKTQLEEADETSATTPYRYLPEEIGGRAVSWTQTRQGYRILFAALLLLGPVFYSVHADQKVKEAAKRREMALAIDYPQVVWELTMLLGAGMTIHDAFFRIAKTKGHVVYEEMRRTCIAIHQGASEAAAYERFGQRCVLPQYARLGTMLAQGLKKGASGLAQELEKESKSAMELRTANVRKLGEQAGTRLLFPMVLMLGVVVMILILPAFFTM